MATSIGIRRSVSPGRRIATVIGVGAMAYLVLRPVSNNSTLMAVLGVFALTCGIAAFLGRKHISPILLPLMAVQFGFGLIWSFIGAVGSAPGLYYQMLVYVVSPAIWWLAVRALDERSFLPLLRWMAIATIVLSGLILLYVGAQNGYAPHVVPDSVARMVGFGYGDVGYTRVRSFSISSLAGAVPLFTACLLIPKLAGRPSRWLCFAAAASGIGASLVTGRRGVVLVVLVTPVVYMLARKTIMPRRTRHGKFIIPLRVVLATVAVGVLLLVARPFHTKIVGAALQAAVGLFVTGNSSSPDDVVRAEQVGHLISGWGHSAWSVVWGDGFGAVLPDGYFRSVDKTWQFEMQYHLLLFNTGVLGLLTCVTALALGIYAMRVAARCAPDRAPLLVAAATSGATMLLANISNPYLQVPGQMWPVFLPLGVANAIATRQRVPTGRTSAVSIDRKEVAADRTR